MSFFHLRQKYDYSYFDELPKCEVVLERKSLQKPITTEEELQASWDADAEEMERLDNEYKLKKIAEDAKLKEKNLTVDQEEIDRVRNIQKLWDDGAEERKRLRIERERLIEETKTQEQKKYELALKNEQRQKDVLFEERMEKQLLEFKAADDIRRKQFEERVEELKKEDVQYQIKKIKDIVKHKRDDLNLKRKQDSRNIKKNYSVFCDENEQIFEDYVKQYRKFGKTHLIYVSTNKKGDKSVIRVVLKDRKGGKILHRLEKNYNVFDAYPVLSYLFEEMLHVKAKLKAKLKSKQK
jgi:hypothetical protein